MSGPTFIECDRIDLQTVEEEDIEFLQRGVNHPKIRRHIEAFRTPINGERYEEIFESIDSGEDVVSLLAIPREGERSDEPIGSVQLYPINDARGSANFGVWFLPQAWGKGYAIEASAYLIDYGFRQMRLHRISAAVDAPNEASIALCERLGFVHEGTSRDLGFTDGEYVDMERYGLLADEWNGQEVILEK
jgi:ribosomal-protein-alanine N-acetyltransferase